MKKYLMLCIFCIASIAMCMASRVTRINDNVYTNIDTIKVNIPAEVKVYKSNTNGINVRSNTAYGNINYRINGNTLVITSTDDLNDLVYEDIIINVACTKDVEITTGNGCEIKKY